MSRVGALLRGLRARVPQPGSPRFRLFAAALIGCAALLGSLGAWRAEVASSAAEDVERRGLDDVAADQRTRADIAASLQEIAYDYLRAQAAKAVAAELEKAAFELDRAGNIDDARRLLVERVVTRAFADLVLDRIERDAIVSGRLDLSRKLQIEYRQAADDLDLDPAPEFARADDGRRKSGRLVAVTALVIAAALFVTLAQVGRLGSPTLYLFVGVIVLACGASLMLALELGT